MGGGGAQGGGALRVVTQWQAERGTHLYRRRLMALNNAPSIPPRAPMICMWGQTCTFHERSEARGMVMCLFQQSQLLAACSVQQARGPWGTMGGRVVVCALKRRELLLSGRRGLRLEVLV